MGFPSASAAVTAAATRAESMSVTCSEARSVAAAVTAAEADGNPCDAGCAVAVGRALGAQWVVRGTVAKTSNLVWILTGELLDVAAGRPVLADGYELKGDARTIGPAGAH